MIFWCFFLPTKGKAVTLQAWSGPEGSRKLRFPDFMTTAQDGSKFVSLTHRPPLPQQVFLIFISIRGWADPRSIARSEGFYVNEKSTDTSWDLTSDLPICSTTPWPLCHRGSNFLSTSEHISRRSYQIYYILSFKIIHIPCSQIKSLQTHQQLHCN